MLLFLNQSQGPLGLGADICVGIFQGRGERGHGVLGRGADPAQDHRRAHAIAVDFVVHGRNQRVLQGIDLAVPKGSFVSLIGPSGCGKSTLLKVLAGLVPPSEGNVTVAGECNGRAGLFRRRSCQRALVRPHPAAADKYLRWILEILADGDSRPISGDCNARQGFR